MELGVNLPTANMPNGSVRGIVRVAQAAERLGYGSVWTYERLLYPTADVPQPGGPPRPLPEVYRTAYDPLEVLAFVAAMTERVGLGTSVVDALFHAPVVLAKRYATVDQLSNGRAIAGLGQGWMSQEFATANVPQSRKGAGMTEFVEAMRATWGPDPVRYEGRFYSISGSIINPKPVRPGGVPIIFGSMTPAGIQRAAQISDGLNPIAISFEQVVGMVGAFRSAAQAAGRDVARLQIHVRSNNIISPRPLPDDNRPFVGGSADQIVADLKRLAELNLTSVFISAGYAKSMDDEERLLEELMQAARSAGVVTSPAPAGTLR
jgi:probable F420-dependent oxidoreductase